MEQYDRVCAYVDLDAILYNLEQIKHNIAEDTQILAVIKADGYGHGAVRIAEELEKVSYVCGYATATPEEAFALRRYGIKKPILILGYTFPYSYDELIRQDIRPAVFRPDQAKSLSEAAIRVGKKVRVHIKVDTAMSRIGIRPDEEGLSFIKELMELPGIEIEGIFTHFARADEKDKTAVLRQLDIYRAFLDRISENCPQKIPIKHCSNSAGIVEMPYANMDIVRAGIILYGLWPSNDVARNIISLKPVLSLKSHIVYIKEIEKGTQVSYGGTYTAPSKRKIATIPVGYADGYPRSLSGKGVVLLHGRYVPVVGRICMDQFMIDITEIPDVEIGDEVTLIGRDGQKELTMEYLGDISGRFNYELACGISDRVPRVYYKDGKVVYTKDYYKEYH